MKIAAIIVSLVGVASAFAPIQHVRLGTALGAAFEEMPGATMPFKCFDPLGLANLGSESTLAWFRAAELKHSRVAMLATTGYLVQAAGWHFPGMLSFSSDVSFESLSTMKPFDAWDAVPDNGKAQIFFTIFFAEVVSEYNGVHYTKGGDYPTIVFPPINLASGDADKNKIAQSRELNNGRLAMIAIMSFAAAANVPGSVPALIGNPMF